MRKAIDVISAFGGGMISCPLSLSASGLSWGMQFLPLHRRKRYQSSKRGNTEISLRENLCILSLLFKLGWKACAVLVDHAISEVPGLHDHANVRLDHGHACLPQHAIAGNMLPQSQTAFRTASPMRAHPHWQMREDGVQNKRKP